MITKHLYLGGLAALACYAVLSGCAGDRGGAAVLSPGTLAFSLPLPETLASDGARAGSYVEADLVKAGADYDTSLPNANVVVSDESAQFDPEFGAAPDMNDAAFCIYRFSIPAYDRDAQLRLSRSINPASYSDSWIGLADWDNNRWDWRQDEPDEQLELVSIEPYISAGDELLVVVLELGSAQSNLDSLRLGSLPPQAAITADPQSGAAPLAVHFDAAGSSAVEGSITRFEWDPEGDGTFETDTGTASSFDFEFTQNGVYASAVRVTNTAGISSTTSTSVDVNPYWQHHFSAGVEDAFYKVHVDAENNLYLLGFSRGPDPDNFTRLLLIKVAPAGETLWARAYSGTADVHGYDLGAHPDGGVVVIGTVEISGQDDCLVQHWSADGQLQWSKSFGSAESDAAVAGAYGASSFYLAGDSEAGGAERDVFVAQLSYAGVINWSRRRDLGDSEYTTDISLKKLGAAEVGVSMACTQYSTSVNDPWIVEWQSNGTFDSAMQFDDQSADIDIGGFVYHRPGIAAGTYYMAGSIDVAGERNLFILSMPPTGSSHYGLRFPVESVQAGSLSLGDSEHLLVSALAFEGDDQWSVLARFDRATGVLLAAQSSIPQAGKLITIDAGVGTDGIGLAGFSLDAAFEWEELQPLTTNMSMEWVTAAGTGANLSLSTSTHNGNVTDILEDLSVDQAGDLVGAYAAYRPFL